VSNLEAARGFYVDLLGFDESFTLANADGLVDVTLVGKEVSSDSPLELVGRPASVDGIFGREVPPLRRSEFDSA
jgi:catechol 2,3-dioxygenase-like lactoylglutathione lyase family enzyme